MMFSITVGSDRLVSRSLIEWWQEDLFALSRDRVKLNAPISLSVRFPSSSHFSFKEFLYSNVHLSLFTFLRLYRSIHSFTQLRTRGHIRRFFSSADHFFSLPVALTYLAVPVNHLNAIEKLRVTHYRHHRCEPNALWIKQELRHRTEKSQWTR